MPSLPRPSPLYWINLLWRKRVLQAVALFLGAVWGLVEVVIFLVSRYRLTDNIVDMVGLGALLLLPSVLLWSLRERDDPDDLLDPRDLKITAGNLLLSLAVVYAVFGDQAVGRATDTVAVLGETGTTEVHEVPRSGLLRSISLTPLRRSQSASEAWLGMAAAYMLQIDLSQHGFVRASMGWGDPTANEVDPGRLSVQQRQQIARRARADYFVDGEVAGDIENLRIELTLYQTDPLRSVAELRGEGKALAPGIDLLSTQLIDQLDLPADRAGGSADGPVEALFSESREALAALFRAELLLATRRDLPAARAELDTALASDPGFALAGLRLYQLGSTTGDSAAVKRGLEIAFGNRERLTEEVRCSVRIAQASYAGQIDVARRIARACVDRFPNNPDTRRQYALMLLTYDGDIEAAIGQFQQMIALGGSDDAAMLQIARLKERSGDETGAAETYRDYLERHAFDPGASMALASLEERQGQPEQARERLLEATAHHDDSLQLQAALALFLVRQGEIEEAKAVVAGLENSDSLQEQDLALQVAEGIARSRGEITEALAVRERRIKLTAAGTLALARLSVAQDYAEDLEVRTLSPDHDAMLEAAFPGQDDIANLLREMSRLQFALRIGAVADLQRGREALESMISRFGRRDLAFLVALVDARIAQLQGQHEPALQKFAEAHASFLRDDGRTTLSEMLILRLWLESAILTANAEAGETPERLLARLLPNHPRALLMRARFLQALGDKAEARTLAQRAMAACARCDDTYAPKAEISRLLDQLSRPAP